MSNKILPLIAVLLLMNQNALLLAQEGDTKAYQACLLSALSEAADETTIADLKAQCKTAEIEPQKIPKAVDKTSETKPATNHTSVAATSSEATGEDSANTSIFDVQLFNEKTNSGALSKRVAKERETSFNPYVITPHKMNYLLPISMTSNIHKEVYGDVNDWSDHLENIEGKLQISFKVPLNIDDIFVKNDVLFFGFTLQSWWQVYSDNISKPFRETNYQPEFFYSTPLNLSVGDTNSAFMIGLEHQSNGRSQPLSRSWNRLYLNWLFEYDNFALSFKPWYRLPEDNKLSYLDSDGDDNPDIDDYMGYFELGMAYQWDEFEFHFIGHQNFSTQRGGAELGVTFPIWGKLRGYLQYFGGYGESLIDYNHSQHRIGLGFALTDIL